MSKICLIDGSGYIFRAFYALPTMTAPDGMPVNAVYGFITMFMRLLKAIKCDYCVVMFDAKRENFRNEIYPLYKATRNEIPELLIPQFNLIYQAVDALNIPHVVMEGYEADDLIATYARKALDENFEVVVVSADKDLMQLIRPGVEFYDSMKDRFFTKEDVKEKFGVYPDRVIDVQALAGDKVDNVPGVPQIGLKIAAELINQFGSLREVLDNVDKIKQQKRQQLLREYREDALVSLKLVKLKDDVPVVDELAAFKCREPNADKLIKFVDDLGFHSIKVKLEKWVAERCAALNIAHSTPQPNEEKKYVKVKNRDELAALYREIVAAQKVCLQVLYNGKEVEGITLSTKANSAYYVPVPPEVGNSDLFGFSETAQLSSELIKKFLLSILENNAVLKIALNLKSQWHWLNGLWGRTLNLWPYEDVAVMSYDLDSSEHEHTYEELCERFLDFKAAEPTFTTKRKFIDFNEEKYHGFVFEAADYVLQLYGLMKQNLFNEHKTYVYEVIDRRLVQILMEMETAGITINEHTMSELDEEFTRQLRVIENAIFKLVGESFNLGSPRQIGEILFEKMALPGGKKTPTGNYNTSAEVLEILAEDHEVAAKILEWRSYAKLKSTYTTALLEVKDRNSRVHTTFSQTVVNTGRLASSNPNLQNIPNRSEIGRKIRSCFVAREGYKIVAADYSQMELRLLASVANVRALKEAFAAGIDIHTATAARVFGMAPQEVDREHRNRAKAINFGIVYGISQFGLAKQINTTKEVAKQYIDTYFAVMPEIKEYMEKTIEFARRHGYVLTPMGRKCAVAGINDKNHRISSFAERAAINAPIQGGAADIVKLAMQQVDKMLKDNKIDGKLLLQVHDELVLEVKTEEAQKVALLLKDVMEKVVCTEVAMVVEVGIGDNWSAAH